MQLKQIRQILLLNPWFNQLPDGVIDKLVEQCKVKTLKKSQILHARNDTADGFYCVLDGRIRVSNVNSEGKEMVLTWLSKGAWFGEISLFDGLPRTHDAHADQDTSLLMLPNSAFQKLLKEQPQLYPHFMRLLCQRIRATFSLIDETGGLSLKGQLAKRLLLLCNGLSQTNAAEKISRVKISQESLAQMINSSRQTVNKLLNELKRENIITSAYGKIEILDFSQLEKLSEI